MTQNATIHFKIEDGVDLERLEQKLSTYLNQEITILIDPPKPHDWPQPDYRGVDYVRCLRCDQSFLFAEPMCNG